MNYTAAYNVCRRWIANGCQIINKCKLRTNKHTKLTPEIVAFMVNPKILSDWAPYSLNQRAILIEQKFGFKISYNAVAEVYKKHKVSYCQPQYAYCRKMEKEKEIA